MPIEVVKYSKNVFPPKLCSYIWSTSYMLYYIYLKTTFYYKVLISRWIMCGLPYKVFGKRWCLFECDSRISSETFRTFTLSYCTLPIQYIPVLHVNYPRAVKSNKLVGFISAVPANIRMYEKSKGKSRFEKWSRKDFSEERILLEKTSVCPVLVFCHGSRTCTALGSG
jgi:hypothetical protein